LALFLKINVPLKGMSDFFIDAPSGTNFKDFSCVEGFVKVSNINGNLRLTENLEIQR
jgi:hypothetical protein